MKSKMERQRDRYQIYRDWISFLGTNQLFVELGYLHNISYESKIAFLNAIKMRFIKSYENDMKEVYANSIRVYNYILGNFTRLFKELNIDSVYGITILNAYLLWNGYFSFYKDKDNKDSRILTIPGLFALDVINGQNTCLSFSNLLKDCLINGDMKAATINCGTPFRITRDYIPKIRRDIKDSLIGNIKSSIAEIVTYPITRGINHVITLIDDEDKYFAFDPVNLLSLNINNQLESSIVNGTGTFKLKPNRSLITCPSSDPYEIYTKLFDGKRSTAIDNEEEINTYEKVLEIIKNNRHLIDDFYDNNYGYYETIHDETMKYGNRKK